MDWGTAPATLDKSWTVRKAPGPPPVPIPETVLEYVKPKGDAGAKVQATDPVALGVAREHFGDRISYMKKNYDALKGADALLIVTEWNEFRYPDFEQIKELLNEPVVFDGRNIFNRAKLEGLGYTYYGIGV